MIIMTTYSHIIVRQREDGGAGYLYPAPECGLPIEVIAKKDVPPGVPYLIVPADKVPSDLTFYEAFEADFSSPDGHGEDYGIGSAIKVEGFDENFNPILRQP